MNVRYRNQKKLGIHAERAQAIVEFAIVLPILMILLVGIFEVGRMVYTYAAVNNASRESARYGSAVGFDDTGTYLKYRYCDGIKNAAARSAYFTPLTISITYDHGPGFPFDTCDGSNDTSVNVNTGTVPDRVQVSVTAHYKPLIKLIPIPERDITSVSARTIMGYLDVNSGTFSGSGGAPVGSVPTSTTAPTSAPTAVPSNTLIATLPANTPTSTVIFASPTAGDLSTLTPFDTYTPTLTPTETLTPTMTFTPTLTFTPTATSTPAPGCNQITTSVVNIIKGAPSMSMTITNPHESLMVYDIQASWNSLSGGPNSKSLILQSVSLGGVTWTVIDDTSPVTTMPPTTVTIPGNNLTSTIIFNFDKPYQSRLTELPESITITLSTVGCEGIQIKNKTP